MDDCISLYEVLIKFYEMIFDTFQVNVDNALTLPGLAFAIFRAKYLPKNTIHMLTGQAELDLKEAFTGGSVDMFIPTNDDGELIYCYDMNSIYPYVMATKPMPVGKPTYFEGNIL